MGQNLKMNPIKRDYMVVNGSPVPSDDVLDQAYFALLIPSGKWQYGVAGQGSLLYTLENQLRTTTIEQQYQSMVQNAIDAQMIQTGRALSQTTVNTQATPTGTANTTTIVPAATQISSQLGFSRVG